MSGEMQRRARPIAAGLVIWAPVIGLGFGCASVDPAGDHRRAEELVADRVGAGRMWSGNADAQTLWDGTSGLSVDVAVKLALAASPEIGASMERIAAARADLVQAGLLPNPVLNFSLGFPVAGSGGETSIGASLVQQLAWLLTAKDRRSAAASDLDSQVLHTSERALELAAEVKTLHARLAYGELIAAERRSAVSRVNHALDLARRQAEAGEGSALEVNRREIRVIEFEQQAARADAEIAVLKRRLLERLGRADGPAEWTVDAPVPPADPHPGASEDRVIELASTQRLDVAAAAARHRAACARAGLAQSEVWAGSEVGAAYSRDDAGRDELGPAITVPVPIFDTGAAHRAKAVAEARAAGLEAEALRARAVMQARSAFVEVAAARGLLAGRAGGVGGAGGVAEIADRNLELSRRAFSAGTLELTGLLEAEEAAAEVRVRVLELRRDAVVAEIELERAVGGKLD